MKPWREVARPHADVLAGTFVQSDFAADLMRVVDGTAPDEYRNAEQFYERTYVTEGMKQLLMTVAQRLNGRGGDPVIELKTNFGGGKTHTLLAVYHLATYAGAKSELSGVADVLQSAGVHDVPATKVAVIDGNAIAPNQPIREGGHVIRTLWGNLAWQLLGPDGYAKIAESDKAGTSPGKALIEEIVRDASPCVILMDELVAYYRQFNVAEKISGGTYESNVSFAQALTEAVKGVPQAILLVSLPSSDTEAAGTFGRLALETLEKTFGRVNAIWRPVSAEEGFAIVKRRLFDRIEDSTAVEETSKAFVNYYHEKRDSLPVDVQNGTFPDLMRQCYPIHPEVFNRLYEDWSTLPNFQKTRGVLQYMAIVINRLWESETDEPLILPASIPLCDTAVANKSTQFLPNGWGVIIDREIDGATASPVRIDDGDSRLGLIHATVRVARTIFMGSAASTAGQAVRGIERKRILFGCGVPGQDLSFYEDALVKMREQLQYLFIQDERYWYDTRPNLSRTMIEYKARLTEGEVQDHIESVVRGKWGAPGGIAEVHVFSDHDNVPDDIVDGVRVVVLPMDYAYCKQTEKRTFDLVRRYLDRHGPQPRMRKNRLLFLAADFATKGQLDDTCRIALAWHKVRNAINTNAINATKQEETQVEAFERNAEQVLKGLIGGCFKHLIEPVQEGSNDVVLEIRSVQSAPSEMLGDAVKRTLDQGECIVRTWAAQFLKGILDQYYFKDGVTEVSSRRVWQDMASYLYFPRIVSASVFCETLRVGVTEGRFGYARGKASDGSYIAFAYGTNPGAVGVSDVELIIKDAVAQSYQAARTEPVPPVQPSDPTPNPTITPVPGPTSPLPTPAKKRFVGAITVDVSHDVSSIQQVVDEVVSHFTGTGAKVKMKIEIEANNINTFPPSLVRTVSENAHALNFVRAEFS